MEEKKVLSTQDEDHCRSLFTTIMLREGIEPFLHPTEWKQLGLYNYPKIVKQHMDLTIIKNKLDTQQYPNANEFCDDINLLLTNNIAVYGENHPVGKLATEIYQWFTVQYNTLFNQGYDKKEDQDAISTRIALESELVFAGKDGSFEDIRYLVETRNISVNAVDQDGSTSLMGIASCTSPDAGDIFNYLLERKADINHVQHLFGWTALISACFSGNSSIIIRILQEPSLSPSMIYHRDKDGNCAAGYLARRYSDLKDYQLKGYLYSSQMDACIIAKDQAEETNEPFNEDLFSNNLPNPSPNEPTLATCLTHLEEAAELLAKRMNLTTQQVLDAEKWETEAHQYLKGEMGSGSTMSVESDLSSNIVPTNSSLSTASPSRPTVISSSSSSPLSTAPLTSKKGKQPKNRLSLSQTFFSPRKSMYGNPGRRTTMLFSTFVTEEDENVPHSIIPNRTTTTVNEKESKESSSSVNLSSLPASPSSMAPTNPSSRRTSDIPINSLESSPIPLPPNQIDLQSELLKNLKSKDNLSFSLSPFSNNNGNANSSTSKSATAQSQSVPVSPVTTMNTTPMNNIINRSNISSPSVTTNEISSSSSAPSIQYRTPVLSSSSSSSSSTPVSSKSSSITSVTESFDSKDTSDNTFHQSSTIPSLQQTTPLLIATGKNSVSFLSIPLLYILLLFITWITGSRLSVDE